MKGRRLSPTCKGMSCSWRVMRRGHEQIKDLMPFDPDRARFTFLGRCAVWRAALVLGLGRGDDVLVPAYNCGSELDPLARAGVNLIAYRVDRAMRIDLDDINHRVTPQTKAVYVIHYFGFPQSLDGVRRFCDERGLPLIEDCALALLTGTDEHRVGILGDIAIYSLRKLFPVPDGGAIVLNNHNLRDDYPVTAPAKSAVTRRLLPLLARSMRQSVPRMMRAMEWPFRIVRDNALSPSLAREDTSQAAAGANRSPLASDDHFDPRIAEWGMSKVSRRIISHCDRGSIIGFRRRNYLHLLDQLRDIAELTPLWPYLPDDVCPVAFPVTTPHRNELCDALISRGVGAIPWWAGYHSAIRWEDHPDAVWLKDHVLALPVHQGLTEKDMVDIASAVRACALALNDQRGEVVLSDNTTDHSANRTGVHQATSSTTET